VAIAAGSAFSLALKGDGTVWAWGSNEYGQLADGTSANQTTPVQVTELSGVVAISASGKLSNGGGHSLALRRDETVWAWGSDEYGQLGDGAVTQSPVPLRVSGLTEVAAIAAGESHSMAVKADGTAWSWGWNGTGQLGDGTTTNRSVPARVSGLDGVIAAAAGVYHSLALKADGTVWKWGDSYPWGESYQEEAMRIRPSPVQVTEISQAVAIAAGNGDSYALKSDGTVWSQNSVPVPVGVAGSVGWWRSRPAWMWTLGGLYLWC
jgi:alpha-tubulin suppressor-like RCC1 family protein